MFGTKDAGFMETFLGLRKGAAKEAPRTLDVSSDPTVRMLVRREIYFALGRSRGGNR